MTTNDWLKLIIAIVVCECAGGVGSFFTIRAIKTWYAKLKKPKLNPPSWVFGPVWTTLYLLMGFATFLVWQNGFENPYVRIALIIFVIQLILNAIWPAIFFGAHSPRWGFACIVILWLAIIATMTAFSNISPLATWLLLPYILWVTFAGYLNFEIWRLN